MLVRIWRYVLYLLSTTNTISRCILVALRSRHWNGPKLDIDHHSKCSDVYQQILMESFEFLSLICSIRFSDAAARRLVRAHLFCGLLRNLISRNINSEFTNLLSVFFCYHLLSFHKSKLALRHEIHPLHDAVERLGVKPTTHGIYISFWCSLLCATTNTEYEERYMCVATKYRCTRESLSSDQRANTITHSKVVCIAHFLHRLTRAYI